MPNYYQQYYASPIGQIWLLGDAHHLTHCYFADRVPEQLLALAPKTKQLALPAYFAESTRWLVAYFSGSFPDYFPPMAFTGTELQKKVWQRLLSVPAGSTLSYSALAAKVKAPRAIRAVASSVARNPISILVPCHRIVHKNPGLCRYGGGVDRKLALLEHETTPQS